MMNQEAIDKYGAMMDRWVSGLAIRVEVGGPRDPEEEDDFRTEELARARREFREWKTRVSALGLEVPA